MKKFLYSVLALLLVSSAAFGASPVRAPNIFYINGENIELSDALLQHFRESWNTGVAGGPFATSLHRDDQQWVLDFIAVDQGARVKPPCEHLILLDVKPYKKHIEIIKGQKMESGAFDELWSVNACGHRIGYRVFNIKGTTKLGIYEVSKLNSNKALNLTAPTRRSGVPFALRAPAAG